MKDFRDDLLKLLLDHVGEFVDIAPLVDKYCGEGNTFDDGDNTKVKCRLNVNLHLRELKELGWINMTTQGGLSTSHRMNHDIGKREFTLNYPVKIRMTTKGELEYKALTKQNTQPVTNIQNFGNNSGIAIQGSDFSEADFLPKIKPTITPSVPDQNTAGKISLWRKVKKEVWAIIIGVLIIVIGGYILWKLGWI